MSAENDNIPLPEDLPQGMDDDAAREFAALRAEDAVEVVEREGGLSREGGRIEWVVEVGFEVGDQAV